MITTFSLITLLILLVTFLPLWRNTHWIIRGMDFPRLQLAMITIILFLAQLFFLDHKNLTTWVFFVLTLLCFARQIWWIVPYTFLWPREVQTAKKTNKDHRLSIMTANVLTTNHNSEAMFKLISQHNPDILVTLESDQWWQDQLDTLQSTMPYSIKCPLDNFYGMHVYSRLQLEDSEIKFLVEDGIPSIHTLLKLRTGDLVRMHFLHPAPPSPTENPESAERDAELVIVAHSVADCDRPLIVTGDFNDVPWSTTTRLFRKISGLLDPRVGRGIFNTFHADYPFLRWPLDHLFHSHHFTLHSIQRLPLKGSDHFALFTELSFMPQQGSVQKPLPADSSDWSQAESIAENMKVSKEDVPNPGE